MSTKRRQTLKMEADEAAVVAPLEFWSHLETHFELTAEEFPEYAEQWREVARHIRDWVEETRSQDHHIEEDDLL